MKFYHKSFDADSGFKPETSGSQSWPNVKVKVEVKTEMRDDNDDKEKDEKAAKARVWKELYDAFGDTLLVQPAPVDPKMIER